MGFATVTTQENARRLAAIDPVAREAGVRLGQSVADTLAVFPELTLFDAEPEDDARALTALASWCARFSPSVAVDGVDGVFLDIDGCAHFWGGEEDMARALQKRLAEQQIPARIAVADTFGAAWALSHYGAAPLTVLSDSSPRALAPLPVAALRVERKVSDQLWRLGLKTIGHVLALPRPALQKRFDKTLLRQLDYALGAADETLSFLHPPAPWIVRRVFSEPLTAPASLQKLLFDLSETLCSRLYNSGLGARRFQATFYRVDGETGRRSIGAALPMHDAKRLAALFAPKLETLDPGFGVEVVTLEADGVQPLRAVQTDLVAAAADARNADLAPLIDRLRNRLGADNVWRAAPYPSHAPERAVTRLSPLDAPQRETWRADQKRPVRLFQRPQPIEVIAPVPDDPPVLFRWQGRTHRVRNAEGPERIGAEWWRREWAENSVDRLRDYYRVEDENGARFWVFRTGLYGHERATRWYLHGLFA